MIKKMTHEEMFPRSTKTIAEARDSVLVEMVARLISEQDRFEADEASDFVEWHWEERADLAREIVKMVREAK